VDWTSVDDAIGEAIDVATKIEDDDEDNDEIDDVEINWDDEIEEIEVTSVLELAPTRVREDGKLSTIVT